MIDDLALILLEEWNKKTLNENYTASFEHYVKTQFPRSYERVMQQIKYYEEIKSEAVKRED